LTRSRHASVRSLERYARPGPEAVGRAVAEADPPADADEVPALGAPSGLSYGRSTGRPCCTATAPQSRRSSTSFYPEYRTSRLMHLKPKCAGWDQSLSCWPLACPNGRRGTQSGNESTASSRSTSPTVGPSAKVHKAPLTRSGSPPGPRRAPMTLLHDSRKPSPIGRRSKSVRESSPTSTSSQCREPLTTEIAPLLGTPYGAAAEAGAPTRSPNRLCPADRDDGSSLSLVGRLSSRAALTLWPGVGGAARRLTTPVLPAATRDLPGLDGFRWRTSLGCRRRLGWCRCRRRGR
jgi:hypothetical protein